VTGFPNFFADSDGVKTAQGIGQQAVAANFFARKLFAVQQQNPVMACSKMAGCYRSGRTGADDDHIP
jgi:hypothetical protein